MIKHYYLDESGHTGDLANAREQLAFGRQPVFALGCVGVDDVAVLDREIDRLKALHDIRSPELKASAVEKKPRFISDLVEYLASNDLPLLIEVVDKRFMIAANLVENLFARQIGAAAFKSEMRRMMNMIAEYVQANAPAALLRAYIDACCTCSKDALAKVFDVMLGWLKRAEDEVGCGMYRMAANTYQEFMEISVDDIKQLLRLLPVPDTGTRGQPVWMLPNLSSLMNIYARINHQHQGRIDGVKLFHDEQRQYGDILQQAKAMAESNCGKIEVPRLRHADFNFDEAASLIFAVSNTSPGIQVADALAGFVMRYVKRMLYDGEPVATEAHLAFEQIVDFFEHGDGQGINFVMPAADLLKLDVLPITSF
ncbi:MAG: DUF3800 domain-containing protein [Alphaproteobacteria bacterium]|nr:DUF3800 domain-containing protein [Alphaproteobacteria bacterium]